MLSIHFSNNSRQREFVYPRCVYFMRLITEKINQSLTLDYNSEPDKLPNLQQFSRVLVSAFHRACCCFPIGKSPVGSSARSSWQLNISHDSTSQRKRVFMRMANKSNIVTFVCFFEPPEFEEVRRHYVHEILCCRLSLL